MRLFVFLFALSLQAQPLFFRGVSFTAERGVRYESPEAIDQLDQLTKYSVDSVALIPFAFTPRGETKIVFGNDRSWESDAGITVAARAAHEQRIGGNYHLSDLQMFAEKCIKPKKRLFFS